MNHRASKITRHNLLVILIYCLFNGPCKITNTRPRPCNHHVVEECQESRLIFVITISKSFHTHFGYLIHILEITRISTTKLYFVSAFDNAYLNTQNIRSVKKNSHFTNIDLFQVTTSRDVLLSKPLSKFTEQLHRISK